MEKKLLISGMVVVIGLLLGRVSGFFRELLIAHDFGLTAQADIAVLLMTIPDMMTNFLIGGGVAAALIPALSTYSNSHAHRLYWQASLLMLLVFSSLAMLLTIFPTPIIQLFAPGISTVSHSRFIDLFPIVVWVIPLSALAAVSAASLQAQERFILPAMGTFIFNMTLIFSLSQFRDDDGLLFYFAIAIVCGGLFRWLSQSVSLGLPTLAFIRPWLINRKLMIAYLQASSSVGIIVLLPVLATVIASFYQTGSIAVMNYVNKLVQFPLVLCLSAFTTVLLPRLAKMPDTNQLEKDMLTRRSGNALLAISVVMTGMLLIFCVPIIHILLGKSMMTEQQLTLLSNLSVIAFLSIPAQALSSYFTTLLNARGDTRSAMYVNLIGLVSFIVFALWLSHVGGLSGIVSALTLAHYIMLILYCALLRYQYVLTRLKILKGIM